MRIVSYEGCGANLICFFRPSFGKRANNISSSDANCSSFAVQPGTHPKAMVFSYASPIAGVNTSMEINKFKLVISCTENSPIFSLNAQLRLKFQQHTNYMLLKPNCQTCISFSASSQYKRHLQQLFNRIKETALYFPGWILRLYHNISAHDAAGRAVLCRLSCYVTILDICDVRNIPLLGEVNVCSINMHSNS